MGLQCSACEIEGRTNVDYGPREREKRSQIFDSEQTSKSVLMLHFFCILGSWQFYLE